MDIDYIFGVVMLIVLALIFGACAFRMVESLLEKRYDLAFIFAILALHSIFIVGNLD